MTKKTHKQKDGSIWEWEENDSIIEYINQMHRKNVGDTEGRQQNSKKKSKKS